MSPKSWRVNKKTLATLCEVKQIVSEIHLPYTFFNAPFMEFRHYRGHRFVMPLATQPRWRTSWLLTGWLLTSDWLSLYIVVEDMTRFNLIGYNVVNFFVVHRAPCNGQRATLNVQRARLHRVQRLLLVCISIFIGDKANWILSIFFSAISSIFGFGSQVSWVFCSLNLVVIQKRECKLCTKIEDISLSQQSWAAFCFKVYKTPNLL